MRTNRCDDFVKLIDEALAEREPIHLRRRSVVKTDAAGPAVGRATAAPNTSRFAGRRPAPCDHRRWRDRHGRGSMR
jgi:hypothetical protein